MTTKKTTTRPKSKGSAYNAQRHDLAVELGHMLRQTRLDQDMTTRGLAEAAGLPQSTVLRYEYGEREPRIFNLVRICRALKAVDKVSDFLKTCADKC